MAYNFVRRRRNPSIFEAILSRQIYGAYILQDIRLVRKMIESGRPCKKVCQFTSRSPIVYIPDLLYFNSFSLCYDLANVEEKPQVLYKQGRRTSKCKIEEMLLFESPLDQSTFCKVQGTFYANGPYTIGLTADNYLKAFDVKTGKTLKEVYMLPRRKFKYLNWETPLERLVVQSTLQPQRSPGHLMQRLPTPNDQVLSFLYIAVFNVTPVEFLCMLPISQKVFGNDLCNAGVRNGMLMVVYQRQKVQIFSFENILKNHTTLLKLGDSITPGNTFGLPEMDEFTSGIVGQSPLGLPANVTLLEKPTVLFEVTTDNNELCFGGYPWHCITKRNQAFHVRSVKTDTLAENGILSSNTLSLGNEKAIFHMDFSARIFYIGSSYIRCLKLHSGESQSTHKINEQFMLDFRQPETASNVQTRSGRKVKQLLSSYNGNVETEIVQDFDYDDEMDLLVVLSLSQTRSGEGIVGFYDNQTGSCVQKFTIDEVSEDDEHSLAINRSTLVIISKMKNTFKCLVYVLNM